jgi:hypothetical protein
MYSSRSIIIMIKLRWMRWAWYVALLGEKRNAYRIMVGKPEGNRPLGKPGRVRQVSSALSARLFKIGLIKHSLKQWLLPFVLVHLKTLGKGCII